MKNPETDPTDYHQLLHYEAPPDLLSGRVILITGAAEGIGRSVALRYARHGARLVLLDWNRKGLEALNDDILELEAVAPVLCPADLSGITIDGLRDIVRHIEEHLGRLDGLLNNASWIGALSPFEHYAPATWSKVMNVNLAAPFFLTQWCLPLLRKAPDPVIGFSLHQSSRAYWGGFAMAKAGQQALLQVLAEEYHLESSQPVRIFGVDTGPVMTAGRHQHYPGEAPDAHPYPDSVTGPYLYAMGPAAAGHSPLWLRNEHEDR
ncbi:MAG: SDR family NAD(P)-dependent oxidoreductase [Rhodanobacter sp.]|nr:MAG: SDR family NAD(P)-dependent oxidoreductase [Rhodanobacter sp.]